MKYAVEFDNVIKKFADITALNRLTFSVKFHTVHAVVGHNGAGKTTSFLIANKLLGYDNGVVRINGVDLKKISYGELSNLALVSDKVKLYKELTVNEILDFYMNLFSIKEKNKKDSIIAEFGLESYLKKKIGALSTGMYKKTLLAISFLTEPQLLFLDEPFSGLDPIALREISDIIKHKKKRLGTTIIISSHVLDEIELIADDITVLNNGECCFSGRLDELFSRYSVTDKFEIITKGSGEEKKFEVSGYAGLEQVINKIFSEKLKIISFERKTMRLSRLYERIFENK